MHEFIYMSDQEAALNVCVREAIEITRSQGEWVGPIPEHSAVGESQSNARAERAVQGFEDQLRTILAALESRLNARIPSVHPIMRWMVEHTAALLNNDAINDDTGTTGYYETHGKDASEKLAEFGERILFFIPKARRAKLDLRFTSGIYLGTCTN